MTKRLDSLLPGERGVISAIYPHDAQESLARRLNALGFRAGRQIELLRAAFARGPLHVRVGTTEIMLRRGEAGTVEVRMDRH